MGFNLIPVPGLYLQHKKKNPKLFVGYCKAFVEKNMSEQKAIGIKTTDEWTYIMAMPNYESKRAVVKGKGKTKSVTHVPTYNRPIECYLSEDDIKYLKSKGMDKHGNKID